jgi:hypothetical protein
MLYIIFSLQLSPLLPPRHILIIAVKFKNRYSYLESYQKNGSIITHLISRTDLTAS